MRKKWGVAVWEALLKQGQIWRLPYLEDEWLEMTVYFIKNAINENQYKSAGSGRWVVVGGADEEGDSPALQGQIWRCHI